MFMAQFSSWVFRAFMTTVKNKNEKKNRMAEACASVCLFGPGWSWP